MTTQQQINATATVSSTVDMKRVYDAVNSFTDVLARMEDESPKSGKGEWREDALSEFKKLFDEKWASLKEAQKEAKASSKPKKEEVEEEVEEEVVEEVDLDTLIDSIDVSKISEMLEALEAPVGASKEKCWKAFCVEAGLEEIFETMWSQINPKAKGKKSKK